MFLSSVVAWEEEEEEKEEAEEEKEGEEEEEKVRQNRNCEKSKCIKIAFRQTFAKVF